MKQTISGKELHSIMVLNGKSLRDSAKQLGISTEEFMSYFGYDEFDIEFIEEIRDKLKLLNVVEIPNAVTPGAIDLIDRLGARLSVTKKISDLQKESIDEKQQIIDKTQKMLIEQLEKMLALYVIIDKYLPKIFKKEGMEENYQYIRKILIEHRGHSF